MSGELAVDMVSVMTMARYLIEDAAQRLSSGEIEQAAEALQNAGARIRDSTDHLVALSSRLRPRVLDDLGLLPALSWYLREFARDNRAIFVAPRIAVSEADVPVGLKLPLFRIVQIALSNVAQHSRASAARVYLSYFEQELRVGIEDNGVGFDVERWRRRHSGVGGCGLGMIQLWVDYTGGRCIIEAVPRHGSRVQVFWRTDAAAGAAGTLLPETHAPPAPAA